MKDMRMELSQSEKLARKVSNIENDNIFFNPNEESLDKMIENKHRNIFNERVEEINQKFDEHSKKLQEYADEYASKLDGVEIMPLGTRILVQPYAENPFQKVKISESGLITDMGGKAHDVKNTDTGEVEKAEQYIHVGVVVEAGPDSKYIKTGDTIMWLKSTELPVPFYSMGLYCVPEQNVVCVINDGLTERFKNIKNGKL